MIVYCRKEGRALGEVTKFLVYNARKRQAGGDRADAYFAARTECVAGVQDMRFQELMPDVLHWLGISKMIASRVHERCQIQRYYALWYCRGAARGPARTNASQQMPGSRSPPKKRGYYSDGRPECHRADTAAGAHLNGMRRTTAMSGLVTVIDHPLVQHKLTLMRRVETSAALFRALLREISMLLAYEVTRDIPLTQRPITTPIAPMQAPVLAGKKLVLVSIMRAGDGILDGMLELIPSARVGHIGLYRDPRTRVAIEYYFKVPEDVTERDVLVVDPMLATGNSAVAAVHRLKEAGAKSLKFVCLLAAPEGLAHFHEEHP